MAIIENFAELPEKERRDFAEALIKTINSESLFSSDVNFEVVNVYADEFTGGLVVEVDHSDTIEVDRKGKWQANSEEEANEVESIFDTYAIEYEEQAEADALDAFKTTATVLDGYKVSLEIADVDTIKIASVEADHISQADAGIGRYEYMGHVEYDSQPYVEAEGTVTVECVCSIAFFVEPDDAVTAMDDFDDED
jgi:hypothetical protein